MKKLVCLIFVGVLSFPTFGANQEAEEVEQKHTLLQKFCNGALDTAGVLAAGLVTMGGAVAVVFFSPEVIYEIIAPEEYDAVSDDIIIMTLDEANRIVRETSGMNPACIKKLEETVERSLKD